VSDPLARFLILAATESRIVTIEYWRGTTPGRTRKIQPKGLFTVLGYPGIYVAAIDMERSVERCYLLDYLKVIPVKS
jgi:predicted DNA-binding transcriptional regulator YafY